MNKIENKGNSKEILKVNVTFQHEIGKHYLITYYETDFRYTEVTIDYLQ